MAFDPPCKVTVSLMSPCLLPHMKACFVRGPKHLAD
ncbi:hypothetical protein BDA96_02G167500 [Sorghum bicolor]|uniref:Uncharacterized protein n=2 Tax=Sorghum bicolor TaxID=4558 RepID=A0A921USL9_SORBI|nr:hypothetical protein BDA96_02G167500 [Sorghum bicolor]OQU89213.1 hypothetical protein SORBI_3002G160901 [Sorghum bicolor]